MHETRSGEMAALGEVPFGLYYGGVDSTPLFVLLAGAYAERTHDMVFVDHLWPALEAAMGWVERSCDTHPQGFLAYARAQDGGLVNQGWKDSNDSIFHADGRIPEGPIALIEVQGYVFAARRAMARMAERRGDRIAGAHWRARATALRHAVGGIRRRLGRANPGPGPGPIQPDVVSRRFRMAARRRLLRRWHGALR